MRKQIESRNERIRRASRQRREQEKEELRQAILKAAGELFLEQGYDRFSMRQLAERIGYSVATTYLYFRDKDDLLFTVVHDCFTRFKQQLQNAIASSDDPWERLDALGQAYITFGLRNPVYYQLMFAQRIDFLTQVPGGELSPRLEAFRILRDAVQYAMDGGVMEPSDAESYGDLLWAIVHGVVSLATNLPMFDDARVQKLITVARNMILQAFSRE